jgi:predicted Zn-dependent protease
VTALSTDIAAERWTQAFSRITEGLPAQASSADHWSLRLIAEETERLAVRQDVLQPVATQWEHGLMVSLTRGGGTGYAATSDLSRSGLHEAFERAAGWARIASRYPLGTPTSPADVAAPVRHRTTVERPWRDLAIGDKLDLLFTACRAMATDDRIVDRSAQLLHRRRLLLLRTSAGADVVQDTTTLTPALAAVASDGHRTQVRTRGGALGVRQGGLEQLTAAGVPQDAPAVAEEAIALLLAPACPAGRMHLLLLPGQMALQIHESIGHPLELDRILGDERNYAGTSFVTPEMFGTYRYGSPLLNVTFDPTVTGEAASYAVDDDGSPASRENLIRAGVLERPLGASLSQLRAGMPGVANARTSDWFRPTIDRMANLNLEPGAHSLEELVAGIAYGVMMDTNSAWSIDDSRNKFQFGCEMGRLVVDGELRGLVRNPNYRGISATFWRSLDGVGDRSTLRVEGVGNCGKGEPNQMVAVGHASPACRFRDVEVFGGEV